MQRREPVENTKDTRKKKAGQRQDKQQQEDVIARIEEKNGEHIESQGTDQEVWQHFQYGSHVTPY